MHFNLPKSKVGSDGTDHAGMLFYLLSLAWVPLLLLGDATSFFLFSAHRLSIGLSEICQRTWAITVVSMGLQPIGASPGEKMSCFFIISSLVQ